MNKALEGLDPPGSEALGGGIKFVMLSQLVVEASSRYQQSERRKFLAWLERATKKMEQLRGTLEPGSGGLSVAEQNKELDEWIKLLKSFVIAPLPTTSPSTKTMMAN